MSAFWGHTQGIGHALLQILALSVVLELFVIASPYYMQLAVDEVIARGDANLLTILALGFGLLTVIGFASSALRNVILLFVQNTLHFQMGARLFHHLLRLPLTFFEKRHIGDILSRFGSIEPIRDLLSEGLIAALIDGAMALITLAMIVLLQRHPGDGRVIRPVALRHPAARPVPHLLAAQPSGHSNSCEGELDLHRNRPCRAKPEALSTGRVSGRPNGSTATRIRSTPISASAGPGSPSKRRTTRSSASKASLPSISRPGSPSPMNLQLA